MDRQHQRLMALVVLAIGVLPACARTAAQPADAPLPQVTAAEVISRDITEWDEFTGRLEAVNAVAVRPRVSGFVAAVRFQEGAIVSRGDCSSILRRAVPVPRGSASCGSRRAGGPFIGPPGAHAARLAAENAISEEERDARRFG